MRRALLVLLLVSCHTVSNESRPTAQPSASTIAFVDAAPPAPAIETDLQWGTRPSKTGELFPVVDGMCIHAEAWPTKGSAIFTYGNGYGAGSRGSVATWARFVDDGFTQDASLTHANDPKLQAELTETIPVIQGSWPVLFMDGIRPAGRMRAFTMLWQHDEQGWNVLGGHNEPGEPNYDVPVLTRGWLVSAKSQPVDNSMDRWTASIVKAWPVDKSTAPIPGITSLGRADFAFRWLAANDTTIFAAGSSLDYQKRFVRWLADGKVGEVAVLDDPTRLIGTTPTALLFRNDTKVWRLESGKITALPVKLPASATIRGDAIAPNGDLWLMTSKSAVLVVHGDVVTETPLPAPASPGAHEDVQHWPGSGSPLAGVEVDDPYAIGAGGSLFHLVSGQWAEVVLPKPPFATVGKYQAQAVVVPAKGDPYVNVGYAEKGLGWKTAERYRAILRAKRPKETLRCNEPAGASDGGSGSGFMSFPPIADDQCKTPVVMLMRLAWNVKGKSPTWKYDKTSDYPSVRDAIKATPSLGATIDLVETESGDQRYLLVPVPSIAAGKELALGLVKRWKDEWVELRPEVVCGVPRRDRVLHVDVSSGKVTAVP